MNVEVLVSNLEREREKLDAAIAALRVLAPTRAPKPAPVTTAPKVVRRRRYRYANPRGAVTNAVRDYLVANRGPLSPHIIADALPAFAGVNGPRRKLLATVKSALRRLGARGEATGTDAQGWSATTTTMVNAR